MISKNYKIKWIGITDNIIINMAAVNMIQLRKEETYDTMIVHFNNSKYEEFKDVDDKVFKKLQQILINS